MDALSESFIVVVSGSSGGRPSAPYCREPRRQNRSGRRGSGRGYSGEASAAMPSLITNPVK